MTRRQGETDESDSKFVGNFRQTMVIDEDEGRETAKQKIVCFHAVIGTSPQIPG